MRKLKDWEKDCVIELEEFISTCKCGGFIDYDGCAHPMLGDQVDDSTTIYPSDIINGYVFSPFIDTVVWYNK